MSDPFPAHDKARVEAEACLNRAILQLAIPMGIAVLLCGGWWWWRWIAFAWIGIADILFGLISLALALQLSSQANLLAGKSTTPPGEPFAVRQTTVQFLGCASLALAAACVIFAIHFSSDTVVVVENQSERPIPDISLIDTLHAYGPIHVRDLRPGHRMRCVFPNRSDAGPSLSITWNGQSTEYPLGNIEEVSRLKIVIQPGGTFSQSRSGL